MAVTFPAAAAINNVAFPWSLVFFGTRPSDAASALFVDKGTNLQFRDNSAAVNNEMQVTRLTSATDMDSRSTTLFQNADGRTHLAVSVSSGGTAKIYKNNVEVAYRSQQTAVGSLQSDAASDLVFSISGTSDHCAFYNTELSGANISALYNSGAGVNCYTVLPGNILVSTDSPGPGINTQPEWFAGPLGGTATMNYAATSSGGTLLAQVQFSFNGETWVNLVGATSTTSYTTGALTMADNGTWYRVVFTDDNGNTTSAPVRLWVSGLSSSGKGRRL